MSKPSFVYLLQCSDGCTYVGATVDVDHRLRQHNKEIAGGAVATTQKIAQGKIWERICYVSGFPNWQAALQFEWRWKQISRKSISKKENPLVRRFHALNQLLSLERATSKAIPYVEWSSPPEIHFEKEDHECFYHATINKSNE